MKGRKKRIWLGCTSCVIAWAGVAIAHITPPVVLLSDRDAVVGMMEGATRFFVREVRLTPAEVAGIDQQYRWRPEDDFYRFYIGRDAQGKMVAAVTFLTEYTIHGPVRVAVGLKPDGRVKDAKVVEVTEETFSWVKPLLDQGLTNDFVGRDSRGSFALSGRFAEANLQSMPHFYGQIVASLIQRGAILYEVTILKGGKAA
jgi:hypothetical protein